MSKVRTSSGHVLSVQSRTLGSSLDGDHTAGVTTLTVQDCSDFDDETGGSLTLNGTTYVYSNVDDDASTLTITPALAADASDGDDATMLDPILGSPQYAVTASVTEDGEDPGDSIEADVASNLVEQLVEGIRGVAGEAVTLTWDEDDNPTVTGLAGLNDAQGAGEKFMQDELAVTATGDQTLHLSYVPKVNSEHLYWNGVYQPGSEWSRDGWTVTIPDPGGLIKIGHRLVMEYAYTDPAIQTFVTYDEAFADLNVLGRWDLDETSGTVAHATVGTDGTIVNSPALGQPGLVTDGGTAIATTWGLSQDITLPISGYPVSGADPAWITFWFKYGSDRNPFSVVAFRDNTGPSSIGYVLDLSFTNAIVRVSGQDHTLSSVPSASLLDGQRHFFMFAMDGNQVTVFIDGAEVDTWTWTGFGAAQFWIDVVSPLHFGRYGTLTQYANFTYDRVAIGAALVSEAQASAIWTAGRA